VFAAASMLSHVTKFTLSMITIIWKP